MVGVALDGRGGAGELAQRRPQPTPNLRPGLRPQVH